MRYRLSSPWPLQGGSALAPNGTIIDSAGTDMWSIWAQGLIPPYDAAALDAGAFELMQRSYPHHHHLMGPPPEASR
jgi:hypothetical protein